MRKVAEVMTSPVSTVDENSSIAQVKELFEKLSISGAPVVDRDGRVLGLISNSDLVRAKPRDTVTDLMTPFLVNVSPEDTVAKVMKAMVPARIHRVVVTENGAPVGIITSLDLVKDYLAHISS